MATSYRTKEKKDVTEWHRLVAFGRTAEIVRDYVDKGSQVYIEGQLQTREWEKDGGKRYTTEVVIRDLSLLGNKAADRSRRADMNGATGDTSNPDYPESDDDNIPF